MANTKEWPKTKIAIFFIIKVLEKESVDFANIPNHEKEPFIAVKRDNLQLFIITNMFENLLLSLVVLKTSGLLTRC